MSVKKKMITGIVSLLTASSLIMTQMSLNVVYAQEDVNTQALAGTEVSESSSDEINEGEKEVIAIRTAEELSALSKKCNNNKWSANKRIELQEDISLMDVDFEPIPIFAGTFNGNGHTISGFYYKGSGYVDGFFRYITQTGIVQDLTVTGMVEAENEEECSGGICGVNGGWILNCSFGGKVEGKSETGGIAGENESSGTINNCSVYGRITGYDRAGGIVGSNYGVIRNCRNRAGVNSDSSWLEEKDEAGLEWLLEDISEKKLVSGTDIGGIAGFSKGLISNCTNSGVVGYEHNGYNIGGIVGRQSGQVKSCSNIGNVYGRKDVGGIVGQMEPYISIEEAESVSEAVKRLHDLIDKFLDDASKTQDDVSADFDTLRSYADNAVSDADSIAGETTDFINKNVAAVNESANRIDYIMDRMPYILDDVHKSVDKMKAVSDDLKKVVDALKLLEQAEGGTYDETKYARLSLVSGVGGNVYSDKAAPAENEEVRITVTPEAGYKLSYLSAADADKNSIELTETESAHEGSHEYIFTMPVQNVVVKAEFASVEINATAVSGSPYVKYVSLGSREVHTADKAKAADATGESGTPGAVDMAGESDTSDAANATGETDKPGAGNQAEEQDKPDADNMTGETDKPGAANATEETDKPGVANPAEEQDKPGADNMTETSDSQDTDNTTDVSETSEIKIIPESNAGGKADCSISGNTATLTVRANPGYRVEGTPAVSDGAGNAISVSKQGLDGYVYTFSVEGAVSPVRIKITFMPDTDSATVSASWSDLSKNAALLQTQMQNISNITAEIDRLVKGRNIQDFSQEDITRLADYMLELAKELSAAGETLSYIIGDLAVISEIMKPYIEASLKKAGVELSHVTEDLKEVMSYLDSAFGLLRSTILYVNGKFDIQFEKLSDNMSVSINGLFDGLEMISSYAGRINDDISRHSDILETDLRAINDQINVIFQLFVQKIEDVEDLYYEEGGYEDISDEDIDGNYDGKVERSVNSGIVKGDINVGGISGSMAIDEEDPEGNAAGSVHYSFGSRYLTKCIIDRCRNEGKITAKKDGVGGIAGYMNLGIVANSEAYGSAESTDGEYIGGISGESLALIKGCWSLVSLKGSAYIGGIAGAGKRIQDCYAMAIIDEAAIRKGEIAGWIDNKEDERFNYGDDIKNNFFVSGELSGIDEISYMGIAEPIAYEALLNVEGVPLQFRHLQLTFIAGERLVERMEVEYGAALDAIEFPEAPYREGSYGKWPDVTNMNMNGNITLEAEYYDNITTLPSTQSVASKEGDGTNTVFNGNMPDKPYAYIDGIYTGDAKLNISTEKKTLQETKDEAGENAESVIYGIVVEDGGLSEETVSKVRLYNPYKKIKKVMENTQGGWSEIAYKEYGSYIQIDMHGDSGKYCIISGDTNSVIFIYILAGAALLLAAVIVIRHRIHSKPKPHKEA